MNVNQLFWTPPPSRTLSHDAQPSRFLKRPVCSPEPRDTKPAVLAGLRSSNSTIPRPLKPRQPPSFTFHTKPSLLVRTRFSVAPLLVGSSVTWKRKCFCISLERFDTLNRCLMGCTKFFRRTLVCRTKCNLLK